MTVSFEQSRPNLVPAVAVIREGQALFIINGSKGSVDCEISLNKTINKIYQCLRTILDYHRCYAPGGIADYPTRPPSGWDYLRLPDSSINKMNKVFFEEPTTFRVGSSHQTLIEKWRTLRVGMKSVYTQGTDNGESTILGIE